MRLIRLVVREDMGKWLGKPMVILEPHASKAEFKFLYNSVIRRISLSKLSHCDGANLDFILVVPHIPRNCPAVLDQGLNPCFSGVPS